MKTIAICILALVALGMVSVLLSMPVQASPQQQTTPTPTPTPAGMAYFPFICKNGYCGGRATYVPPTMPLGCSDPSRGDLYRALVTNTQTTLDPIYVWGEEDCCSLDVARLKGHIVGDVLQLIPTTLYKLLGLGWQVIVSSTGFIGSILRLTSGVPTGYEVNCANDAEFFCLGLGAIAALDDMAGGWITVLTILVVAIMGFYLALYVIREVRNMMQPGAGGEGD